jgi:hypothetical protein
MSQQCLRRTDEAADSDKDSLRVLFQTPRCMRRQRRCFAVPRAYRESQYLATKAINRVLAVNDIAVPVSERLQGLHAFDVDPESATL